MLTLTALYMIAGLIERATGAGGYAPDARALRRQLDVLVARSSC